MRNGIIPAMITPTVNEKVNLEMLAEYTRWLAGQNISALFALGTTGEGLLLDFADWKAAVKTVVEAADNRVPVVVQAGGMSMRDSHQRIQTAADLGVKTAAVVAPFFYHYDDNAMDAYYSEILGNFADMNFFLYNIPKYAGNTISSSLYQSLADRHKNLIGIKDSTGTVESLKGFTASPTERMVFSGSDSLLKQGHEMGINGIVSGIAAVLPELLSQAWADLEQGRTKKAELVKSVRDVFHQWSTISCVRTVLNYRGVEAGQCLKPLPSLSKEDEKALMSSLHDLGVPLSKIFTR